MLIALVLCSSALEAAAPSPHLVFQELEAEGVTESETLAVRHALCAELARTERVSVLCGDDLKAMMKYAALAAGLNACSDGACFESVQRALKARFVLSGSLAGVDGAGYRLHLLVLDTGSGQVVARGQLESAHLDRLEADLGEVVTAMVARVAPHSRAARKKGG